MKNASLKNILYSFACLSFAVVIGAAIYEHAGVVPQWSEAPPRSLSMFQGPYGLKAQSFWIPIHPVTLILLIVSLFTCWRTPRKNNVVITIAGYVLVLAITFSFFVPELLSITGTPYNDTVDEALTRRANTWEVLSIIRLFFLICLAINLMLGLTKNDGPTAKATK